MKTRWSRFAHVLLLLAGLAAGCAQAQQDGRHEKFKSEQFERREKFRSEQFDRRQQHQLRMSEANAGPNGRDRPERPPQGERRFLPMPDMPRGPREMNPGRPPQGEPGDDAQRVARERHLERRALLRRQINEARDIYPPPGRP